MTTQLEVSIEDYRFMIAESLSDCSHKISTARRELLELDIPPWRRKALFKWLERVDILETELTQVSDMLSMREVVPKVYRVK